VTDRLPLKWSAIIASLIDPKTGLDDPKTWSEVVDDFTPALNFRSELEEILWMMVDAGLIEEICTDRDGWSVIRATPLGRQRRAEGMEQAEAVIDARAKTTGQRHLKLIPSPTPFDGRAAAAGDE
jgi:hypothetical protein